MRCRHLADGNRSQENVQGGFLWRLTGGLLAIFGLIQVVLTNGNTPLLVPVCPICWKV